jgi:outer membrane protein TolC
MKRNILNLIFCIGLTISMYGRLQCQGIVSNGFVSELTLDQSLRLALQNNTVLLSAEQDVIIAKQRVKEAIFRFFPQPSLSGSATKYNAKYPIVLTPEFGSTFIQPSIHENFYSAGILLTQPIYTGKRNTNTLRLAKASLKQAQTKYDEAKRDVVLKLKKSFFNFLYAKQYVEVSGQWRAKIGKQISQIRPSDWGYIEAKAITDEMERQDKYAKQQFKIQRLNFLESLNKELDSEVEVLGNFSPSFAKVDVKKAMVWAMELRPELKSEIYKAEMDAMAVNLAISRRSPTVLLGLGYDVVGHEFPLPSNSWYASLAIQFPLNYEFWTQIGQRRAEQRKGDLQRSDLQDKIRLQVQNAYETFQYWQEEVKSRRKNWDFLQSNYDRISKTNRISSQSMRASKVVYEVQLQYLQSVRDQLISRSKLEWALGHELENE